MKEIREKQKTEFEGGDKIRDHKAGFDIAATLSSKLKDRNRLWIKDSLMSIGAGVLKPDDWVA
jgi:hypothetical protein